MTAAQLMNELLQIPANKRSSYQVYVQPGNGNSVENVRIEREMKAVWIQAQGSRR